MWDPRLFQTTRGKVLLLMKKHGACTVADLSQQLGVTPNAIRQHLSSLERDNLVSQRPLKKGPRKPALTFSLTAQGEALFPKRYDSLLLVLVKELVQRRGKAEVLRCLGQMGRAFADPYVDQVACLALEDRVQAVERILKEGGSITEWQRTPETLTVRDFNCPYGAVTRGQPEVCEVQRRFLQRLFGPVEVDTCCDHLTSRCEFQIRVPWEAPGGNQTTV